MIKNQLSEWFRRVVAPGSILLAWFNLIPAWISEYMTKVWGKITYLFPNFQVWPEIIIHSQTSTVELLKFENG